ncbi:response regulator [Leptolyngbya sp. FACHB-541]|uniref:hybrid sensor histidine kinase/response regulator n=1 Tax=Leptolyngbya sp. FACHB-541 TaxID=2692810 RepID=UPI00168848CE|nr:response regulator [Leptolyngbya sp. FACHB-541]MBD1998539.1 response regulator [Leptolyngbya sp. FACHB-541]
MTTILVIEDEVSLREEISELLELEGFQITSAENGLAGLQMAKELLPDLIVCDVMMPELDGHGVLSQLRQEPATALIPFIFLTARNTVEDFRQGMKLGADDYIVKPFKRTDLLDAIATRLTKQNLIVQLQQKIATLNQSNLEKDDFLNTASHELRNPATNILMAIQMLKKAPTKERLQRYLEVLQAESNRELELIDDLLDLQRLETDSHPANVETIKLQDWVPAVAEPFQVRTQARQQTLQINVPPYLPTVTVDSANLKRMLAELLNNACKYTAPSGKIALEVYRAPQASATLNSSLIMLVISNEADIPDIALPRLFDKFYRVPNADRWQQGGSGLGLTLVKKIVERLDGNIEVTSEAGWAQFTVQFPTS